MFIELLRRRRSIRRYTGEKIEREKLDILLEALVRSPHSGKANPSHFVVVENDETLAELAQAKSYGAKLLQGAPLAIAVCGNVESGSVWVENASIAAMDLHLAATDLGLGSCWVQFRGRESGDGVSCRGRLVELLGLPEEMDVLAVVAIGYPAEEKPGWKRETLGWDQIHYEKFGRVEPVSGK